MNEAGAKGRVAFDLFQRDFAAQTVEFGQAVIGQIGVIRRGLDIEGQQEIMFQPKPTIGEEIPAILIFLQVVAGMRAFKLDAAILERLTIPISQSPGLA